MSAIPFVFPRARLFDRNDNAAAGARITFYESNTSTKKDVYTSRDQSVLAENPQILDAEGWVVDGGVWLGSGLYKVKVELPDGGGGFISPPWWTMDEVPGNAGFGATSSFAVVNTIAELRLLQDKSDYVYVAGYTAAIDGGGGWFKWNAALSTDDNGGTIISPNGAPATGRFQRLVYGPLRPEMFGALPGPGLDVRGNFEAMITWADDGSNKDNTINVTRADYYISGDLNFTGDYLLIMEDGVLFTSENEDVGSVTINCEIEISSRTSLVGVDIDLIWNPTTNLTAVVDWFGVGHKTTNEAALKASLNANGNTLKFIQEVPYVIDTDAVVMPDAVEWEPGARIDQPNFGITISFTKERKFFAHNFNLFGTIVDVNWRNVVLGLTFFGTLKPVLHWNKSRAVFDNDLINTADEISMNLTHVFDGEAIAEFNARVYFGKIETKTKCLEGSDWPIISGDVYPQWFGAVGNKYLEDSQNDVAILNAINCQVYSFPNKPGFANASRSFVNGDGETFSLHTGIVFSMPVALNSAGAVVSIRNMNLYANNTPAQRMLRLSFSSFEFRDFIIEYNGTVETNAVFEAIAPAGASAAVMKNCLIAGYDGSSKDAVFMNGHDDIVIKDTFVYATGNPFLLVNAKKIEINGLKGRSSGTGELNFSGSALSGRITNGDFESSQIIVENPNNVSIDHNRFGDFTILKLDEVTGCQVSFNRFESEGNSILGGIPAILIDGAGTPALGLEITKNSWYAPNVAAVEAVIAESGTLAKYGHKATVKDNFTIGNADDFKGNRIIIPSTEIKTSVTVTSSGDGHLERRDLLLSSDDYILPYNGIAIRGGISDGGHWIFDGADYISILDRYFSRMKVYTSPPFKVLTGPPETFETVLPLPIPPGSGDQPKELPEVTIEFQWHGGTVSDEKTVWGTVLLDLVFSQVNIQSNDAWTILPLT